LFEHNERFIKIFALKIYQTEFEIDGKVVRSLVIQSNYGDTDSIMCYTDCDDLDIVIKVGYKIEKFLNDSYKIFIKKHNLLEGYTKIEFEAVYLNMFFPKMAGEDRGTKKTYAGYIVWKKGKKYKKPKFFMKGISGMKGNSPQISKDIQEILLKKGCMGMKKADILPYLQDLALEARECMRKVNGKYDIDKLMKVGIPYNLGKAPDDYENNPPVVRVAKYAYAHFDKRYKAGDTIIYYYIKDVTEHGYEYTDVYGFDPEDPKFPSFFEIDVDIMLEKVLYNKIKNMIPFFDIQWTEITNVYEDNNAKKWLKTV
jgi:hypothetical protein